MITCVGAERCKLVEYGCVKTYTKSTVMGYEERGCEAAEEYSVRDVITGKHVFVGTTCGVAEFLKSMIEE